MPTLSVEFGKIQHISCTDNKELPFFIHGIEPHTIVIQEGLEPSHTISILAYLQRLQGFCPQLCQLSYWINYQI